MPRRRREIGTRELDGSGLDRDADASVRAHGANQLLARRLQPDSRGSAGPPAQLIQAVLGAAGNQAVSQYLARSPSGQPLARNRRKKPPDIESLSDAELDKEIERVGSQLVNMDPDNPRWKGLFDRSMKLHEARDRRYEAEQERELAQEGHEEAIEMIAAADAANKELKELVAFMNDQLQDAETRIREYLDYYTEAYDAVVATLGQAQKDAALRDAIMNFCIGLAVGTGLGVMGGALFESVKGLRVVLVELGGETAEAGAARELQVQSAANFNLPKGLEPNTKAASEWERMSDAWKGAALLNTALLQFGDYRDTLRTSAGELGILEQGGSAPRKSREIVDELKRIKTEGFLPQLWLKMTATREAVVDFSRATRHPRLRKLAYEIEQDIWIGWISGLRGSGSNAGKNQFGMAIPPYMDARIQDALDEDAVEERLERIGLIGERSRLGVDFGWNTTGSDTAEAYEASRHEQQRLDQLGRLGIAITDIREGQSGVVHIRRTAYELAGRKDPEGSMPEDYFRAVPWVLPARKGQVVRVEGTGLKGVEVEPVSGAQPGHVSADDEAHARSAH
jgi:hypothetical protein